MLVVLSLPTAGLPLLLSPAALCEPPPRSFCRNAETRLHSEAHQEQLAAANKWVNHAAAIVGKSVGHRLVAKMRQMNAFAESNWPQKEVCPVFYPFCGVDLINLHGLFPNAKEVFMLAALPLGSFSCFLSPQCSNAALGASLRMYKAWFDREHGAAWSGTGQMLEQFNAGHKEFHAFNAAHEHTGAVGLLPTLLVTMHLVAHGDKPANQNITLLDDFEEHHHKLHANDENTTAKHVTLTWRDCSAQLSYMSAYVDIPDKPIVVKDSNLTSGWVTAPNSERYVSQMKHISRLLGIGDRLRVSMFKAAEPMHSHFLVDNGIARWFLDVSAALVQDPTGLRPLAYSHPLITRSVPWEMHAWGSFDGHRILIDYTDGEDPRQLYELAESASALPFDFGYDGLRNDSKGLLIAAWRQGWLREADKRNGRIASRDADG
jgi:hypothetical protein